MKKGGAGGSSSCQEIPSELYHRSFSECSQFANMTWPLQVLSNTLLRYWHWFLLLRFDVSSISFDVETRICDGLIQLSWKPTVFLFIIDIPKAPTSRYLVGLLPVQALLPWAYIPYEPSLGSARDHHLY